MSVDEFFKWGIHLGTVVRVRELGWGKVVGLRPGGALEVHFSSGQRWLIEKSLVIAFIRKDGTIATPA